MSEAITYSDEEILEAIRANGVRGRRMTAYLFDKHQGYVINAVRKFRLSEEDARDVYTDAIIALNRQILQGKFRGDSKISTYLYSIFFNRCRNRVRDNLRKPHNWVDEIPELPSRARDMLQEIMDKEEIKGLKAKLEMLGETCRKILWDWGYFGYSLEEIAERIGFSNTRSVSSKKSACIKKLRELMAE
ncbi:MAG: sigma-70 family RNA polymerase sigma factor [Bacteroidota bacterium]